MSLIDKFLKSFGAPDLERYRIPINRLEFPREQMLNCLNAVYAKTVEDDLDLPPSLGSKLFEKALNEINIAITDSGLDQLPIPANSAASNWTSLFSTCLFSITWDIANSLGLRNEPGFDHSNLLAQKDNWQRSMTVDEAIGWMSSSSFVGHKLLYWLIQAEFCGTDLKPEIAVKVRQWIIELSEQVDFSYRDRMQTQYNPNHGQLIQKGSDTVYVWKAQGMELDGKYLCKIGITSSKNGTSRLSTNAKSSGYIAEIIVFTRVGPDLAKVIEKKLLTLGCEANITSDVDGYTEFRYLSKSELDSIPNLINAYL